MACMHDGILITRRGCSACRVVRGCFHLKVHAFSGAGVVRPFRGGNPSIERAREILGEIWVDHADALSMKRHAASPKSRRSRDEGSHRRVIIIGCTKNA